jgi:hypothetical protein
VLVAFLDKSVARQPESRSEAGSEAEPARSKLERMGRPDFAMTLQVDAHELPRCKPPAASTSISASRSDG